MLKLEMTFTNPTIVMDDGAEIEAAAAANLYVDSLGVPQLLQVVGKQTLTIPWREVYKISHA